MKRKTTNEEFIIKSKLVHGDLYDYSNTNYIDYKEKTIIICKKHGEFLQTPHDHLTGHGCSICGSYSSTKEFIQKAKKIYGDKYNYDKVNYINWKTKVIITCEQHGDFLQVPTLYLRGSHCPSCINKKKYTTEEFVKSANLAHGYKYTYEHTNYKNNVVKVSITCPTHGKFNQAPSSHLSGAGCPKCGANTIAKKLSSNIDEFITKAISIHKDKYDYSKAKYVNNQTKMIIICKKHGEFLQIPNCHLTGHGCAKCASEIFKSTPRYNIHEFIEKSMKHHGNKYDYSKVNYINSRSKVKIICPKHGEFLQTPNSHFGGTGCPSCKTSFGESKIKEFLMKHNISHVKEKTFCDCKNPTTDSRLKYDFYILDKNILIEYDGEQHFIPWHFSNRPGNSIEEIRYRDSIKTEYALKNNIKLIRIPYTEFDDIESILTENLLKVHLNNKIDRDICF